jgi:hypothetical protein
VFLPLIVIAEKQRNHVPLRRRRDFAQEMRQNNAGEQRRKPIVMQAKDAVGGSVVESFSLKSANGAVSTTRACGL